MDRQRDTVRPGSGGSARAGARKIGRVAVLLILLAACGGPARVPEEVTAFVGPGTGSLDPALAAEGLPLVVALNALQGLLGPGNPPVPGAAELPEVSEDGRSAVFRIRGESRWADGSPVEAADFVRGWRRALELAGDGPLSPALAQVEGAQEIRLGALVIEGLPGGLREGAVASALLPYGAVASIEFRDGGATALVLPSREAIRLDAIPGPPDADSLCRWVRRTLPEDLREARCSVARAPGNWRVLIRLPAVRRSGDLERARRALAAARYRGRALGVDIPDPDTVVDEAVAALDGARLGLLGEPLDMTAAGPVLRAHRAGPEDLGIRVRDARTLEVRLRGPVEEWLALVAVSPELLPWPEEAAGAEAVLRNGNGSFPLSAVEPDGTVILAARDPGIASPRRVVLLAGYQKDEDPPMILAEGPPWPGRAEARLSFRHPLAVQGTSPRGVPFFATLGANPGR